MFSGFKRYLYWSTSPERVSVVRCNPFYGNAACTGETGLLPCATMTVEENLQCGGDGSVLRPTTGQQPQKHRRLMRRALFPANDGNRGQTPTELNTPMNNADTDLRVDIVGDGERSDASSTASSYYSAGSVSMRMSRLSKIIRRRLTRRGNNGHKDRKKSSRRNRKGIDAEYSPAPVDMIYYHVPDLGAEGQGRVEFQETYEGTEATFFAVEASTTGSTGNASACCSEDTSANGGKLNSNDSEALL